MKRLAIIAIAGMFMTFSSTAQANKPFCPLGPFTMLKAMSSAEFNAFKVYRLRAQDIDLLLAVENDPFSLSTKSRLHNTAILVICDRLMQRIIDLKNLADLYVAKHGRLDSGFEVAADQWFGMHPLFTDIEITQLYDGLGQ